MKTHRIRVRGILFDWDGTLLNSYRADVRAYASMFRALGVEWSESDLARHYSPNWYRVYEEAGIPRKKWKEADQLWTLAYRRENPRLLPGVRSTLIRLRRHYSLGLVTSGDRARVRQQVKQFGFSKLFSALVCSEDAKRRKPHPAPLKLAIARMGLSIEECVYVGDAPEDIEMARRTGVAAIGVLGPFPTAERIRAAHPQFLLESISDLPGILTCSAVSG